MAYGDFKDLNRRILLIKYYVIKHLILLNIRNGHQRGFASMIYKFFDKKTSGSAIKNENISNKELAKELYKPIIKEFNKRKYIHVLQIILGCRFGGYTIYN